MRLVLRLEDTGSVWSSTETHSRVCAGRGARNGVKETGLWPHCCPSDIRPHAGHFSSMALIAHRTNEHIRPEARSEPRGRSIKIKMRNRPGTDTKEPLGKHQVLSGINEHILAESLRVQIRC